MAYQTLYRKYRPKTFELVYGQDVIVKTLKKTSKKWLLIWNNYLLRETKICNCKKEITISGIMTSTHLAIIKIEN